jgi:hypothetical protein
MSNDEQGWQPPNLYSAGCRFDSYAAHQFLQATALLAIGGKLSALIKLPDW